ALSYIWPRTEGGSGTQSGSLCLEQSTLSDLTEPGFLHRKDGNNFIPSVVYHAMNVTRKLGEVYLWVGRFCIKQDDEMKEMQISHMGDIYGGAYLTIVGAATEALFSEKMAADDCFMFDTDNSMYRDGRGDWIILNLKELATRLYSSLGRSTWTKRGWTYQEQIMSKRLVIFMERGIFWDCECGIWDGWNMKIGDEEANVLLIIDEDGTVSTESGLSYQKHCGGQWWPDFSLYMDLVCPYSGRNLTYPQDGLRAISSMLKNLASVFPGGLVAGLPMIFLDHVLLWQPS
ncbi:hypothetical protein BS50DRAFT_506460, partial [Corynespora cassiicola Philippines]